MNDLLAVGAIWLVVALVMAAVWAWQRRHGDAGVVDLFWTLAVGLFGAVAPWLSTEGVGPRKIIISTLVSIWAIRLAWHIGHRLRTLPEDGRYVTLKQNWGDSAQRKLFGFYQVQAVGAVLFVVPMLVAGRNLHPLGWLDAAAVLLALLSFTGEALADRQLAAFRADPSNRGKVCRVGLWNYSRHPNYFFEWLHWWVYFLLAWGAPYGWITAYAPLVMLYLILRVTGIPPTEAQAIKSRGQAYRDYQATTSAFFPWFPPTQRTTV